MTAPGRTLPILVVALVGCSGPAPTGVPVPATKAVEHSHGHSHERGKMLLADAGKYHAALTAHLSAKDGNELDIFFETADDPPAPVALPLDKFTAAAWRVGDAAARGVLFEPAPADERPKDEPAGTCSHFVARAGWMTPDDDLTVTAEVEIGGRKRTITWKKFVPAKYAHHVD